MAKHKPITTLFQREVVNLTHYSIHVDGVEYPPSGILAKITASRYSTVLLDGHIPGVVEQIDVVGLPVEVEKGPYYIVQPAIRTFFRRRIDLLSIPEHADDDEDIDPEAGVTVDYLVTNL